MTTARRAVLGELIAAGDVHLNVDELARRVNTLHPDIHLSTVYRTLDALRDAGLIIEARFADQPTTYHLAGDRHHHAVCSECGVTINLPASTFDQLARRLERDYGFRADPHHLTIPGRCATCAAREAI